MSRLVAILRWAETAAMLSPIVRSLAEVVGTTGTEPPAAVIPAPEDSAAADSPATVPFHKNPEAGRAAESTAPVESRLTEAEEVVADSGMATVLQLMKEEVALAGPPAAQTEAVMANQELLVVAEGGARWYSAAEATGELEPPSEEAVAEVLEGCSKGLAVTAATVAFMAVGAAVDLVRQALEAPAETEATSAVAAVAAASCPIPAVPRGMAAAVVLLAAVALDL